jgi:hypothetical protein
MALTHIAFGLADARGIPIAGSLVGESLEPVADDSTPTTVSAPDAGGREPIARIATDTTIWAVIGPTPDVEGEGVVVLPIIANTIATFVVQRGDKVAIMLPPSE